MEQREAQELARTFTRLETWEQFLEEWQAVRSEGGAVGLLYAGTRVPYYPISSKPTPTSKLLKERIEFYLLWAQHEDDFVATTAQQLIVKHWLRETMKVSPPDYLSSCAEIFEFLEVHEQIFWFLRKRHPSLLKPPHPRFIRDYLTELLDTWFTDQGLTLARLRDLKRPTHELKLFDCVIRAFVTWGLGHHLAGNREMAAEVAPRLTTLLAEHGLNPASILASLPSAYEPIEDLSRWNTVQIEHATLVRASASLLALRHIAEEEKRKAS